MQQSRVDAQAAPKRDEAALAEALKARSEDAWAWLYDRHYPLIYRYVLARTSDTTTAEDLSATVFLEALRSISSYSYRGKPVLAWLYRIARNVISDHHKSLRHRGKATEPLDDSRLSPLQAAAAEGVEAADQIDLRDAVRSLKENQHEIVVLHDYLGLSLPEVATLLGKKERAVYSLHARAIEALRRLLGAPG